MSRQRDSQILHVHGIISVAMSSGFGSSALNPSVFGSNLTRLLDVADSWAHFRVKSCRFRVHHGAITADVAVGYVGGVQDTLPSTKATVMELIPSVYQGSTYTVPSAWCAIPPKDLAGPLPWYKTITGTADATEESPGVFLYAGTGTDVVTWEMDAVFEFKTAVAPANTPMAAALREKLREERVRAARLAEKEALTRALLPPGLDSGAAKSGVTAQQMFK